MTWLDHLKGYGFHSCRASGRSEKAKWLRYLILIPMRLKAQTTEKLADRFGPNATREAEGRACRHHQADAPTAALCRFPPPGLRVGISTCPRLLETRHTACGKPRLVGNPSHTLLPVVTKTSENLKTVGPYSHVGLSAAG